MFFHFPSPQLAMQCGSFVKAILTVECSRLNIDASLHKSAGCSASRSSWKNTASEYRHACSICLHTLAHMDKAQTRSCNLIAGPAGREFLATWGRLHQELISTHCATPSIFNGAIQSASPVCMLNHVTEELKPAIMSLVQTSICDMILYIHICIICIMCIYIGFRQQTSLPNTTRCQLRSSSPWHSALSKCPPLKK